MVRSFDGFPEAYAALLNKSTLSDVVSDVVGQFFIAANASPGSGQITGGLNLWAGAKFPTTELASVKYGPFMQIAG